MIHQLIRGGAELIFLWVPSHTGIHGNSVVDRVAKEALRKPISKCFIPHTDCRNAIRIYVQSLWDDVWAAAEHNKLHELKPQLGENHASFRCRRDQVVITRCRIGHSRVTHGHLMTQEEAPVCIPCDTPYSLKHVLLDCVDVAPIRDKYFKCASMHDLFSGIPNDAIISFLKEVGLYYKL